MNSADRRADPGPVCGKQKRRRRVALSVAALLFAALFFSVGWIAAYFGTTTPRERSFLGMLDDVRGNYYEEVDEDALFDRLYDALELDRYCAHYTPEELAGVRGEREGRNAGYGMSFVSSSEPARIFAVTGNSPADLAGLKKGMYVTAFGESEETLHAGTLSELLGFLRGGDSGVFACGYDRGGADAAVYSVARADYLASYCSYADSEGAFGFRGTKELVLVRTGEGDPAFPSDVAYLRLDSFNGNAAWEFGSCLEQMRSRGRKHLILDLRSDGGGYMSVLEEISAHLLRKAKGDNPPIATAEYRDHTVKVFRADGNDFSRYFSPDSRISVLADESTASASESLIGAMLDYGTIGYGDLYLRKEGGETARTFGKGVMQARFTAADGNALRLTVARIRWPGGMCIDGRGITEGDGAQGVETPYVWGNTDPMLQVCLGSF